MDHGKTTLTAAITKVLSEAGGSSSANFVAYDQVIKHQRKRENNNFNYTLNMKLKNDTMLT